MWVQVQPAILLMLVFVHSGVAPPASHKAKSITPATWNTQRLKLNLAGQPEQAESRIVAKCIDSNNPVALRYSFGASADGRRQVSRKMQNIKGVPGSIASLLSTSPRLLELDKETETRIMGIGFRGLSGTCAFPNSVDPADTGTFYYIADTDEDSSCDLHESIWKVLSKLLTDQLNTLNKIRHANDRVPVDKDGHMLQIQGASHSLARNDQGHQPQAKPAPKSPQADVPRPVSPDPDKAALSFILNHDGPPHPSRQG